MRSILAVICGIFSFPARLAKRLERIKSYTPIKDGIETAAEILKIEQTSGGSGGSIQYEIMLSFQDKGQHTVTTNTRQYFSALDIVRLEKNKRVIVRYHPDQPTKVWIIPNSDS